MKARPFWLRGIFAGGKSPAKPLPIVPRFALANDSITLPREGRAGQVRAKFAIRQGIVFGSDLVLEITYTGLTGSTFTVPVEICESVYTVDVLHAIKNALEARK